MLRSHARASPAYGCAGFPKCAALINYHEWGMIEQGRANKGYLGGVDSSYPHMYSFILQVWYEAVRPKSRNGGIQWPGAHTFLECGYTPVLDWPQISTQRRGVEEPKVVSISNARVYRQSWRDKAHRSTYLVATPFSHRLRFNVLGVMKSLFFILRT